MCKMCRSLKKVFTSTWATNIQGDPVYELEDLNLSVIKGTHQVGTEQPF